MTKSIRFVPSHMVFLLGFSVLGSPAQAGWFDFGSKPAAPAPQKSDNSASTAPATNLEDSIHQAQLLRLAGNYDEALNHLSQLMLVAADDPRVIGEYGKTLVMMGRAEEAEKFLTRAQQLQPQDWTIYSALGVAYDQINNPKEAQINYEHALALKPNEPSVLANYALSRMLAKDPVMARNLADRAESANAAIKDEKIIRDIALIRSIAPQARQDVSVATSADAPKAAPHVAVNQAPLAAVRPAAAMPGPEPARPANQPVIGNFASSASAPPVSRSAMLQAPPQIVRLANQAPRGVVMQPVPVDPLAGPVEPKRAANHTPHSLTSKAKSEIAPKGPIAAQAPKPVAKPAKPLSPEESLEAKAEAIAKTLNKPSAIAKAKMLANKAPPENAALTTSKVSLPVKAADVKPNKQPLAPKVLPAKPDKMASNKPQAGKAVAKSKDSIPSLRLSDNAY